MNRYIKKDTVSLFAYKFLPHDENLPSIILHSPDIDLISMTVKSDIDDKVMEFSVGDYLVYDDVLDTFYPVGCEKFEYLYTDTL